MIALRISTHETAAVSTSRKDRRGTIHILPNPNTRSTLHKTVLPISMEIRICPGSCAALIIGFGTFHAVPVCCSATRTDQTTVLDHLRCVLVLHLDIEPAVAALLEIVEFP